MARNLKKPNLLQRHHDDAASLLRFRRAHLSYLLSRVIHKCALRSILTSIDFCSGLQWVSPSSHLELRWVIYEHTVMNIMFASSSLRAMRSVLGMARPLSTTTQTHALLTKRGKKGDDAGSSIKPIRRLKPSGTPSPSDSSDENPAAKAKVQPSSVACLHVCKQVAAYMQSPEILALKVFFSYVRALSVPTEPISSCRMRLWKK